MIAVQVLNQHRATGFLSSECSNISGGGLTRICRTACKHVASKWHDRCVLRVCCRIFRNQLASNLRRLRQEGQWRAACCRGSPAQSLLSQLWTTAACFGSRSAWKCSALQNRARFARAQRILLPLLRSSLTMTNTCAHSRTFCNPMTNALSLHACFTIGKSSCHRQCPSLDPILRSCTFSNR